MDILIKVLICLMLWALILISVDSLQKMDDLITLTESLNDNLSQIQSQTDD